jgi:heme/copper-type cytochrome/quinol oxidase subunit 2
MLLIIAVASAVALAGGITTFAIGIPSSPCAGVAGTTRNFTIIADINGYNESSAHYSSWLQNGTAWPVMNVARCDQVIIKIINNDTQSHGFAVDTYATRGTEIIGGQQSTVEFLATTSGHFRVYCIVYCTVHRFMQYGLLNVS